MRKYLFPPLALLCLLALPAAVPAEGKPAAPTVVVRIAPLDEVLADAHYLGGLADREELVKQLEGVIKTKTSPKGQAAIDTKRPLGFYGTVGAQGFDSTGVLLVPVTDEKAFVALLDSLNLKSERGKDGVYTVQVENALSPPVYFRVAHGYAYVTVLTQAPIAPDALLPPAGVLSAGGGGVASAVVRLDRIPDNLKQLGLEQLGLRLADLRDRRFAGSTPAEKEFSREAFDALGNDLRAAVRDGRELLLRVDVDRQARELAVEMTLDGKPGSRLATTVAELARRQSLFAGLPGPDDALHALVRLTLPEALRRALRPMVNDALARGVEKEADPARRREAQRFLDTLKPTLESGEADAAVVLRPPAAGGTAHTLVLAKRVKDGAAIDRGFRDLVKSLSEGDRERIKLDAEEAGAVKVHRVDVQRDLDDKARRAFGDNPLYLAFRADAVFVALGGNGLAALRQAVAAPPAATAPLRFEVAMARLAVAMAIDRQDDKGTVARAAREAFGPDRDGDRVRLVVEGGQALKLRFSMSAGVLKFIGLLDRAEHAEK